MSYDLQLYDWKHLLTLSAYIQSDPNWESNSLQIWSKTRHFTFCWTRSKFSNIRELECKPGFAAAAGHWFWFSSSFDFCPKDLDLYIRDGKLHHLHNDIYYTVGQSSAFKKVSAFIQTWFLVLSSICYCACASEQFPKIINYRGTQPSTFFLWVVGCKLCKV